jgi:hypothetical protein
LYKYKGLGGNGVWGRSGNLDVGVFQKARVYIFLEFVSSLLFAFVVPLEFSFFFSLMFLFISQGEYTRVWKWRGSRSLREDEVEE